jgi:hypothetical protein
MIQMMQRHQLKRTVSVRESARGHRAQALLRVWRFIQAGSSSGA